MKNTLSDLIKISDIARILEPYRLDWEYQYVDGAIEEDTKVIYLSYPPKTITLMYFVQYLKHPEIKDSRKIEALAQESLKDKNIESYLRDYLSSELVHSGV
jgi:hypothetical protein